MTNEFVAEEQLRAVRWKEQTSTLPEEARLPSPYLRDGKPVGRYSYCLPSEYASYNLLPDAREPALEYFADEAIAWHASIRGGPTNHLLSSQIQCVNALMPMNADPARIKAAFGSVLDIDELCQVEPGHFIAFEYIGEQDYLNEVPHGLRHRGSMTTSADAAISYCTTGGEVEVALIEWKYVEQYQGHELRRYPGKDRPGRYAPAWHDPACPVRVDVLPYEDLFVEPFYQLFRQQLLAWRMEEAGELGASRVRVVHVSPHGNFALHASLNRASHHDAGDDVFDIWRSMVRESDRFVTLDSGVFCDPVVTSTGYAERYG